MTLTDTIKSAWSRMSSVFQRSGKDGAEASQDNDTYAGVDASENMSDLKKLASKDEFDPAIEPEFEVCVMKLVNKDYKDMGEHDGKKCIRRPVEANAQANADGMVSLLVAALSKWESPEKGKLEKAKTIKAQLEQALSEEEKELKINEQFERESSRLFSTSNVSMYLFAAVGMLVGEFAMMYNAVGAFGFGNGRDFDYLQLMFAVAISCSMVSTKIVWDAYVNRPDDTRRAELRRLRWERDNPKTPVPPDVLKVQSIVRWQPKVVFVFLLAAQLLAIVAFSYVRADKHGFNKPRRAAGVSITNQAIAASVNVKTSVVTAPDSANSAQAPVIQSEDKTTNWLGLSRFWAFISFSVLFATLSGICLSYAFQIINNKRMLRKLKGRVNRLKHKFSEATGNHETRKQRCSDIDAMRSKFNMEKADKVSAKFVKAYEGGWNFAMQEHKKATPLLIKHKYKNI
ncbi:hypothetical protein MKQ70_20170 [Chitinophaga sedimenti]|uniref:hypothetical protein n=1 Tax=Chitinophaga sedimenti TaxID=2033606 RepID=UPI0020046C22|nr:hypothetical protein [Chitinophaga sedimenti]MCK7557194.1 hypothetical protein [Chitinophaga sedimenti]